jgi:oxygen-independent coproporphyrinogen-3 oxidase
MRDDLIRRYSRPVPRYTSYPTAPHFHEGIDAVSYETWLAGLPPETSVSLYLHVPFCDRLCWFCGCHTKQVLRYEPIAAYLKAVTTEIAAVGTRLDGRGRISQLHLGGGSPSMLRPADLLLVAQQIRHAFVVRDDFEFSIEIDPNDMTPDRYDGFAVAGITRASIGVQDFDPRVQQAINRIQTIEQTRAVVDGVRAHGVRSVNLDVLYGLPFQTEASVARTIDAVLDMQPDRIALFGYAHVPWMKTHQKMIDEAALPDVVARYHQSRLASAQLLAAGYLQVGMDHFALPDDSLAQAARAGRLHRNFQGYTTDDAPALIGFGASAIGSLPQGYVQNCVPTADYMRRVRDGGLATVRGVQLSDDDRVRGFAIEQLMCNFVVDIDELQHRFGDTSTSLVDDVRDLHVKDVDGLVSFDGRRLALTVKGRPFVRSIAARLDTYLRAGRPATPSPSDCVGVAHPGSTSLIKRKSPSCRTCRLSLIRDRDRTSRFATKFVRAQRPVSGVIYKAGPWAARIEARAAQPRLTGVCNEHRYLLHRAGTRFRTALSLR